MGGSINGVSKNGGFMRENPIKMDDLGVPLFQETLIWMLMFVIQEFLGRLLGICLGRMYCPRSLGIGHGSPTALAP